MTAAKVDRDVIIAFNGLQQEIQAIGQKLTEMESERDEHTLVLDALSPMESDRKCFRLVGGILVEKTVKDVIPSLKANQEGISQIVKQLSESFKKKQEELIEFQKKHNIGNNGPK